MHLESASESFSQSSVMPGVPNSGYDPSCITGSSLLARSPLCLYFFPFGYLTTLCQSVNLGSSVLIWGPCMGKAQAKENIYIEFSVSPEIFDGVSKQEVNVGSERSYTLI